MIFDEFYVNLINTKKSNKKGPYRVKKSNHAGDINNSIEPWMNGRIERAGKESKMGNLFRNVKGSKFWKRILAGALSLLMILTLVPAAVSDVVAADDFEVVTFDGYIKRGDTVIPISEVTEVYEGDVVKINCAWKLSNLMDDTTAPKTFQIDLKQYLGNITLNPQSGQPVTDKSGNQVGEVTIDANGIATYTITDEAFLQEGERAGTSTYDGVVDVENSKENNGKKIPFKVGKDSTVEIKYYSEDTESSLEVYKSRDSKAVVSGSSLTQTFKVKLTAKNGVVSGINLEDIAGSGLSNLRNITVKTVNGTNVGVTQGASYSSMDALNAALANVILAKDEYIELEYTMDVDKAIYDAENTQVETYGNKIKATYKDNRDTDKDTESSVVYTDVTPPTVKKEGTSYDPETGLITWKITIKLNDFLEDFKNSGKTIDKYITDMLDTPGAGQSGSAILKTALTKVSEGEYYLEYTTQATPELLEAIKLSGYTFHNTFKATVGGKEVKGEADYSYAPDIKLIDKAWKSYDSTTKELSWTVTVTIPDQTIMPISKVAITDNVGGDTALHTLQNTIYYNGKAIIENGTITTDGQDIVESFESSWNGYKLTLKDAFVTANSGNVLNFVYKTTIVADDWTNKTVFHNYATLTFYNNKLNKNVSQSAEAQWKDTSKKENAVDKTGTVSTTKDEITYTVNVNLSAIENLTKGKTITLTDAIPSTMKLKGTETVNAIWLQKVYNNGYPYDGSQYGTVAITTDTATAGKIKFSFIVTEEMVQKVEALAAAGSDSAIVRITYTTQIADERSFINDGTKKTIVNRVSAEYDGTDIGNATDTRELTPKNLITKTGEYTEDSAPDVSYTVDINPNALDLVDGDTITAIDEIGSALDFILSSVVLTEVTDSGTAVLTKGVDYDYSLSADKRTLTLTIPDGKHLKLTYKAKVNSTIKVYPLGSSKQNDSLTAENAYNRFSLNGYNSSQTKGEKSIVHVAYTPKHQTVSELRDITLFKYWTDQDGNKIALDGSTFQLRYATYDAVNKKMVDGDIIKDNITVSASDGKIVIRDLPIDKYFVLYETASKEGYAVNPYPYYFVLTGSSGITLPTGIDIKTFSEDENVLEYENSEEGRLKISKSVVNADWDDVKDRISFTVKRGTIVLATFTGNDMVKDGDVYSKTLNQLDPAFNYTVEETLQTVTGRTLKNTTYKVGDGVEIIGSRTSSVRVTKNQTQTVLFTNTYEPLTEYGSLKLEKTVTGDLDWDAVKDSIRFVVKKDGETVGTTYTAADFTLNQTIGKYECVVDNLPVGTYTVTETITDKTGYKRVTTYTVNGGGTQNGTEVSDLEIEKDTEAVVSYENQYTEQVGSLILTKQVTGAQNWDDVKDLLKFEVKKEGASTGTVYTAADFDYDEAQQKATLTIDDLPIGRYFVTETVTDKTGYVVSTTYQVDSTAAKTGNEATVTLTDGQTVQVAFTNDYSDNAGTLKLTKALTGEVPVEEALNLITFRVRKQGETAYRDFALSEFVFNQTTNRYELEISVTPGTYTVEERTRDIAGYLLDTTTYVVNAGTETDGKTATLEVLRGGVGTVDYTNTYSKNAGFLEITKEIKGDASRAEAERALKFRVTNTADNTVKEYTLADFTYHALTGKYTLKLEETAGEYIVEETAYDIDGYILKSVKYKVSGGAQTEGKKTNAEVVKDQTIQVAFEDDYEKAPTSGTLEITKTLKGGVNRKDAEQALKFTVTDTATNTTKEYTLKDFTYHALTGKYTLKLTATEGTYLVTETAYDIDGYEIKSIRYTVDGTAAEDSASANVVADETVRVDIVDTYEKKATTTETTATSSETTETETTETTAATTAEVTTEVTTAVTTEATTAAAGPKTGDTSPIQVVMILGLTACMGAGVLIAESRRKNRSRK